MGKTRRNEKRTVHSGRQKTRSHGNSLLTGDDPAKIERELAAQLKTMGLYASNTVGDGNCLFRALSDQLYGTPNHHSSLRREICDYLIANTERYQFFVDDDRPFADHVRVMRENGTYGGHLELTAFAHSKGKWIKVVQPGLVYVVSCEDESNPSASRRRSSSLSDDEDTAWDTVYLAYHSWEHWSSVRNQNGPHTGLPCVRETPRPSSSRQREASSMSTSLSPPPPLSDSPTPSQYESLVLSSIPPGSTSLPSLRAFIDELGGPDHIEWERVVEIFIEQLDADQDVDVEMKDGGGATTSASAIAASSSAWRGDSPVSSTDSGGGGARPSTTSSSEHSSTGGKKPTPLSQAPRFSTIDGGTSSSRSSSALSTPQSSPSPPSDIDEREGEEEHDPLEGDHDDALSTAATDHLRPPPPVIKLRLKRPPPPSEHSSPLVGTAAELFPLQIIDIAAPTSPARSSCSGRSSPSSVEDHPKTSSVSRQSNRPRTSTSSVTSTATASGTPSSKQLRVGGRFAGKAPSHPVIDPSRQASLPPPSPSSTTSSQLSDPSHPSPNPSAPAPSSSRHSSRAPSLTPPPPLSAPSSAGKTDKPSQKKKAKPSKSDRKAEKALEKRMTRGERARTAAQGVKIDRGEGGKVVAEGGGFKELYI